MRPPRTALQSFGRGTGEFCSAAPAGCSISPPGSSSQHDRRRLLSRPTVQPAIRRRVPRLSPLACGTPQRTKLFPALVGDGYPERPEDALDVIPPQGLITVDPLQVAD